MGEISLVVELARRQISCSRLHHGVVVLNWIFVLEVLIKRMNLGFSPRSIGWSGCTSKDGPRFEKLVGDIFHLI